MATRLSVYRDGILHCQVDVTGDGLRIGRGTENEVTLEDAQKRVSRAHAEIRVEGQQFFLVDLGSANGTFVEGRQISRCELEKGVPFTVGPYRLILEEGPLLPSEVTTKSLEDQGQASDALGVDDGSELDQETGGDAADRLQTAGPAGHRRGETTRLYVRRHWKQLASGAAALLAAVALGLWLLPNVGSGDRGRQRHLDEARRLLEAAATPEDVVRNARLALTEHIGVVLATNEADAEALELQRIALSRTTPPEPAPPPPPPSSTAPEVDHVAEARALWARKDEKGALAALQAALERDPSSAAALALKSEIDKARRRSKKPTEVADRSFRDAISDRWPNEAEPAYRERVERIQDALSSATAALDRRDYDTALSHAARVEGLTVPADKGRKDAADLQEAVAAARAQRGRDLLESAEADQASGKWRRAYDTLQQIKREGFSVPDLDDRIQALRQKMISEGDAALSRARTHFNAQQNQRAIEEWQRALDLLPPDHPGRAEAEKYLRSLGVVR